MRTIQKISLEQIDLSDETFSVNFMPDLRRLRSSIKEIGLIQPVLLHEKEGRYRVVCGFRRVSVFRESGKAEIESRVFGEKETDDLRLFSLSLQENLTTRGFNVVEKAIALDKLSRRFFVDPAVLIETYLPLFSLEPHEKILNTYLSLARMEEDVKRYVLKEEVSRANIRKLSAFPSEDRRALLSLVSPLRLGENRLKEILSLLDEISRRERVGIGEIVRRREIQDILSQENLTPSQRTERLREVLADLRYPNLRRMEKEFEEKKRELHLPSPISLRHPPFFEGRGLRVEFQFETMEEYQAILSSLSLLPEKKEFHELVEGSDENRFPPRKKTPRLQGSLMRAKIDV